MLGRAAKAAPAAFDNHPSPYQYDLDEVNRIY